MLSTSGIFLSPQSRLCGGPILGEDNDASFRAVTGAPEDGLPTLTAPAPRPCSAASFVPLCTNRGSLTVSASLLFSSTHFLDCRNIMPQKARFVNCKFQFIAQPANDDCRGRCLHRPAGQCGHWPLRAPNKQTDKSEFILLSFLLAAEPQPRRRHRPPACLRSCPAAPREQSLRHSPGGHRTQRRHLR